MLTPTPWADLLLHLLLYLLLHLLLHLLLYLLLPTPDMDRTPSLATSPVPR
jgi:hypothetical protein